MKRFSHNLVKSYNALTAERRTLSAADFDLFEKISRLYERKAFEYVQPGDAAQGFSEFPELEQLARLATHFAPD